MQFISFGSGSSGNCYYLYTPSDGLLIDTGIGLRMLKRHFRDFGLSLSSVHNILITHDHADHIKSVGSLSADYQLPVYTTRAIHDGIFRNYCVTKKIAPDKVHYLHTDESIQLGSFHVTPFSVPHDSAECVGYSIDCDGVRFCLITDVGEVTPTIGQHIAAANYLVIEANHDEEMLMNGPYPAYLKERIMSSHGHLSNKHCAEALAHYMTGNLRHVWLCHLSEENNHPELARKTVESILRSYGIVVGADVMLDVLKRTTPSGLVELK
ncbi:MAG: MBL fold metallo-hydrolase [Prevotella sp.]|nr:MBL fold metallo-hydrolase [Prevotella sp.]